jgi:uncharacterized membrane protein
MNTATVSGAVVLGAMTGMRSMSGAATLGLRHGGMPGSVAPALALGELIADKTGLVGNRTDPLPLAGRAVMGAIVGAMVARQHSGNVVVAGLIGASAAVIAAHLAFRIRSRLPLSTVAGGMLEDAVMMGMAAIYSARAKR